mmetsp:Transcript_11676/g.34327  ORF Transcript_11676/g.34327 Transcript_11676/m.34327 type:complete len:86 (+) Transcript_11676:98-355(+)
MLRNCIIPGEEGRLAARPLATLEYQQEKRLASSLIPAHYAFHASSNVDPPLSAASLAKKSHAFVDLDPIGPFSSPLEDKRCYVIV